MTQCPPIARALAALALLTCLGAAAPAARAIALTVHVHFENFAASGQQPEEANLVGWGVAVESETGAPLGDLGTTQGNGDTRAYDLPAGSYVAVLRLPSPDPYDAGVVWPATLRFPFTMAATNPQGQPITTFRLRIGLGCGCNDGDSCTADVCDAGQCLTAPQVRPELPELCDRFDNDCDGLTDEGLPVPCNGNPPAVVGCADGTREGFLDYARYPHIAACGGAWDLPGLDGPALAPACSRAAGNHGANKPGAGCRAIDLCGAGWHVCRGPDELAARAGTCADALDPAYPSFGTGDLGTGAGGPLVAPPGGAFFVARGALGNDGALDAVNGLPIASGGIFGCGNMGLADDRCGAFERAAGTMCRGLRDQTTSAADDPATDWGYALEADWAWSCSGGVPGSERDRITKRFADRQGGVLCCRDSALGLAEVCDGLDNDADGATDDLPDGRAGQSCPLGALCGTLECTLVGGLACVEPAPCDDTTCNGVDEDEDGLTDEEYVPSETTCGVGACVATGERTCVDGDEVDSCAPLPEPEASDVTCDGEDGDCDGLTDEEWTDQPTTCGFGVCAATGTRRCVNGIAANSCVPKPPLAPNDATCNDIDDDCNGATDEDYPRTPTTCGAGACASSGELTCVAGEPVNTCAPNVPDDGDARCDGVDEDCDGATDEDFVARASTCGEGVCVASGEVTCVGGEEVDSCAPLAPEVARDDGCDDVDDDCDGATDDDYVGTTLACGRGGCEREGAIACVDGVEVESCTPGEPADDDVQCDGVDEDCDGTTDEGWEDVVTTCGTGACANNSGRATCVGAEVVDSCDPFEGADVEHCDGEDDDCDGATDEDFGAIGAPCDGDDDDRCAEGTLQCLPDGRGSACDEPDGTGAGHVDVCNGRDDDCDGETDEGLEGCADGDGDGVPDPIDNCATVPNEGQADVDDDGFGDACDVLIQGAGGDCAGGGAGRDVGGWGALVAALLALARNRAAGRARRGA